MGCSGKIAKMQTQKVETQTSRMTEGFVAWTSSQKSLSARVNSRKRVMRIIQIAIIAVSLAVSMSASAIDPLVTNPGGQEFMNTPPPGTEGFTFTTGADPLEYNKLGIYDWGNDGLVASHDVTLFTAAGVQITSATVPNGGSATADSFQWVDIAPVTLSANTEYVLAASYVGDDPDHFYYGSATFPAGVTLGNAVWESGVTTVFPDQVWGAGAGFFGPNMSVPEPATISLVVIGLLAALTIRRRKV